MWTPEILSVKEQVSGWTSARELQRTHRQNTYSVELRILVIPIANYSDQLRPEGSRRLRFPDIETAANEGDKVVRPTYRPPLSPRKYLWYSFLLEAESTPGP